MEAAYWWSALGGATVTLGIKVLFPHIHWFRWWIASILFITAMNAIALAQH